MERIVHEIHRMKNPQLPFVFRKSHVKANGILPNWHENIEILCFLEGEGTMTLDGRSYKVGKGDIGIVNVDRLHTTVGEPSLVYYYLIVDNGYCLENGIDVSSLEFLELIRDEALFSRFAEVAELFARMGSEETDPTVFPTLRYCVLGILLQIFERYRLAAEQQNAEAAKGRARMKELVSYLRNAAGAISLDEIAKEMGMSKFYMCREFKRITGTTIIAYLNRVRCEHARRMIYGGAKVSEAAFAVGFDNLSYFSKIFARYMGARPSSCSRS